MRPPKPAPSKRPQFLQCKICCDHGLCKVKWSGSVVPPLDPFEFMLCVSVYVCMSFVMFSVLFPLVVSLALFGVFRPWDSSRIVELSQNQWSGISKGGP